jgi:hypothetical protein
MPFEPTLSFPLSDRNLLPRVLSDLQFARKGYRWGSDGRVWYCFCNPDRVRFEVWRKRYHFGTALLQTLFFVPIALATLLITPGHFVRSAKEQRAAVFTNGPQMEMPFGMGFWSVFALLAACLFLPFIGWTAIGAIAGTVVLPVLGTVSGIIAGAIGGALVGVNLAAFVLWLIGLAARPYGDVVVPGDGETGVQNSDAWHFGRGGVAFSTYRIGPLDPQGLQWASGGLILMILNRFPAATLLYQEVIGRSIPMVVWGLVSWEPGDGQIQAAIESQTTTYREPDPETPNEPRPLPTGLILVAGASPWLHSDTLDMITQRTVAAVATDGSQSALLGSSAQVADSLETTLFMDPIQRYGFKCVPE